VMPLPSVRRAPGQVGVPVQVGGAWVRAGDWLVADADGVVVLDGPPA
jgi:regulator of ribonuclease activity A